MTEKVGIVGYGAYVPRCRIRVEEIAKVWGQNAAAIKGGLLIEEKSVPDNDEDVITMAVESARSAIARAGIAPGRIGALFVGSESHPYAVKPSGTVVAEAIGAAPRIMVADLEFACKAGTAAMQMCSAFVRAGDIEYGMAVGADTAQGRPGDALEYTAGAGAAAMLIGKDPLATMDHMCSFTTDTPDFWRREGRTFPQHGARFTGEPGYFRHVVSATKMLFEDTGLGPGDFDHVVFHMPNGKFPAAAAKKLGIDQKKLQHGLVVGKIGNTYAGASLIGLCGVLDVAEPGQRILVTSFGSGAGSDAFALTVTDAIIKRRPRAPLLAQYINKKVNVDYGTYAKMRGKLKND